MDWLNSDLDKGIFSVAVLNNSSLCEVDKFSTRTAFLTCWVLSNIRPHFMMQSSQDVEGPTCSCC